ncbi:hypothetical protein KM043_011111 [Ampulex compressa]|nr:hypothetical protein KM043_011111 [Ampulex compressa]
MLTIEIIYLEATATNATGEEVLVAFQDSKVGRLGSSVRRRLRRPRSEGREPSRGSSRGRLRPSRRGKSRDSRCLSGGATRSTPIGSSQVPFPGCQERERISRVSQRLLSAGVDLENLLIPGRRDSPSKNRRKREEGRTIGVSGRIIQSGGSLGAPWWGSRLPTANLLATASR